MLVTIPSRGFYLCEFHFFFSDFYASPLFACNVSHTNYKFYVLDTGIQLSDFKIKLEGVDELRPISVKVTEIKLALAMTATSTVRRLATFAFNKTIVSHHNIHT